MTSKLLTDLTMKLMTKSHETNPSICHSPLQTALRIQKPKIKSANNGGKPTLPPTCDPDLQ